MADSLSLARDVSDGPSLAAAFRKVGELVSRLGYCGFLALRAVEVDGGVAWQLVGGTGALVPPRSLGRIVHVGAEPPFLDAVPDGADDVPSERGVDRRALDGLEAALAARAVEGVTASGPPRAQVGAVCILACRTSRSAGAEPPLPGTRYLLRLASGGLAAAARAAGGRRAVALPEGEREVLVLFADGRTPKEIAAHRNTSVRTVRNQLDNVRRRLGARSNVHAVAIALSGDLVGRRQGQ